MCQAELVLYMRQLVYRSQKPVKVGSALLHRQGHRRFPHVTCLEGWVVRRPDLGGVPPLQKQM